MPKTPTKKKSNARTSASNPSTYRLRFGKHKGKLITQIPWNYLQWCEKNGVIDQYPGFREAVSACRPNALWEEEPFTVPSPPPYDMAGRDARMAKLEKNFPLWLWRDCNDALDRLLDDDWTPGTDPSVFRARRREERLTHAIQDDPLYPGYVAFVRQYPERTESSLQSSSSVDNLREVLARAPAAKNFDKGRYEDDPGIQWSLDGINDFE